MTINVRSWLSDRARQIARRFYTPLLEELSFSMEMAALDDLLDFFLQDPLVRILVLWLGRKVLSRSFLLVYSNTALEDRLIRRVYEQLRKGLSDATYLEAMLDDYILRRASWEKQGLSEKEQFSEAQEFWSDFVQVYLDIRRNNL